MHTLLASAPVIVSTLILLAGIVVALVGRRAGRDLTIRTLLPAAYLLLHGGMGVVLWVARDLDLPRDSVGHVMTTLDVLALLLLGLTLVDANQAARRIRVQLQRSSDSATEYDRARRDYEQLVRHRIANPLAVVHGGIETLLVHGGSLDDETRHALLVAMADGARRLREFTPDPTARTIEEVSLHATPRLAIPA